MVNLMYITAIKYNTYILSVYSYIYRYTFIYVYMCIYTYIYYI